MGRIKPKKEKRTGAPAMKAGKQHLFNRKTDDHISGVGTTIQKKYNQVKCNDSCGLLDYRLDGRTSTKSFSDTDEDSESNSEEEFSSSTLESGSSVSLIEEKEYTETEPNDQSNEGQASSENVPEISKSIDHEEPHKIKYIRTIQFGKYEIDTWYTSPYPSPFHTLKALFICEFCFKYVEYENVYCYHWGMCDKKNTPPGKQVYHKDSFIINEIDGVKDKLFCQNLCLFAKLFIQCKDVVYNISKHLFYVLYEKDKNGCHVKGYFSKEKKSKHGYNVSSILVLPPFQNQGFGKLLIAFSYELSKLEGKVGSPQPPLSDIGGMCYMSFWSWVLLTILQDFDGTVVVSKLSKMTGFSVKTITDTFSAMGMTRYWCGNDTVCVTPTYIQALLESHLYHRPPLTVDPTCINWTPHTYKPKPKPKHRSRKRTVGKKRMTN